MFFHLKSWQEVLTHSIFSNLILYHINVVSKAWCLEKACTLMQPYFCCCFVLNNMALCIRLNYTKSYAKFINLIIPCFHLAPVLMKQRCPPKKNNNNNLITLLIITLTNNESSFYSI